MFLASLENFALVLYVELRVLIQKYFWHAVKIWQLSLVDVMRNIYTVVKLTSVNRSLFLKMIRNYMSKQLSYKCFHRLTQRCTDEQTHI